MIFFNKAEVFDIFKYACSPISLEICVLETSCVFVSIIHESYPLPYSRIAIFSRASKLLCPNLATSFDVLLYFCDDLFGNHWKFSKQTG